MGRKVKRWLGVVLAVLFVVLCYLLIHAANVRKNPRADDSVMVAGLANALSNFASEYGRLPDPGRYWLETEGPEGAELLQILLGESGPTTTPQNPRLIPFLNIREARGKRGGLYYSAEDDRPYALYDIRGRPLRVALRTTDEKEFSVRYSGQDLVLQNRDFAVWALGEDGVEGTEDDLKSWE
ncbi:hypothetical protein HAHE_24100 [Haloferula helveola]|uniref:DUF4340 domain-containing protein n=1 Tax=Haloferula helveola TaxID=490095 RepID=A0ABM7RFJ5_9BACT|nr:hypothetical protein HAHE_24100 [Haloferula helveola]